jgi:hypothetical protein
MGRGCAHEPILVWIPWKHEGPFVTMFNPMTLNQTIAQTMRCDNRFFEC